MANSDGNYVANSRKVDKELRDRDGLTVTVRGVELTGWKNFNISRDLSSGVGSFSIVSADIDLINDFTYLLKVNEKVVIKLGTTILMVGRIYKRNRNISATNTSLTFSGRDIIADLLDCAAITKSNYWSSARLETIASDICKPFGIFVDGQTDYETFPKFTIKPGETAYEAISRACRAKGVLAIGDRFGNLTLNFEPLNTYLAAKINSKCRQ